MKTANNPPMIARFVERGGRDVDRFSLPRGFDPLPIGPPALALMSRGLHGGQAADACS